MVLNIATSRGVFGDFGETWWRKKTFQSPTAAIGPGLLKHVMNTKYESDG